jgi:von Willebrand factor type A C-terminal domain/von Willebrand factor type A domain
MVPASDKTRREAQEAVQRLSANGGTAIGKWLRLADELFASRPSSIRHAILLTDGQNMHETPRQLARTIEAVTGHFVCDCRGIGTDWEVKELRTIADALLGTVDIVAEPEGLEADFRAMAASAMSKAVADVSLRLWTPQGSTIKFVKQVAPTLADLTARRTEVPPRSGDYPTGSWGSETRDYHVCVQVPAASTGEKMLAGRVSLVLPGNTVVGKGNIVAIWTEDLELSTRINGPVAHYTGQAELAEVIQEGLEARKVGDVETATAKLGRAVRLATETGHTDTAKLLSKVVDIEDAKSGTVRLKRKVATVDEMTLDTRSSKTMRVRKKSAAED